MYLGPDLGHFSWIWAIILGFGPFCLDFGHIGGIWAIWQNLGQNRPQRRQSPEFGVRGTNGRMDGQMIYGRTDSSCVLQDFVPFGVAAQKRGQGRKEVRRWGVEVEKTAEKSDLSYGWKGREECRGKEEVEDGQEERMVVMRESRIP